MNVAGRKMWLSIWMPGRPGRISSSALSMPRVTSSVFAHGNFSTTSMRPWLVVDDRVAEERLVAPRHRADVAEDERRAVGLAPVVHGHRGQVGRAEHGQDVVDAEPLVGASR